MKIKRIASSRGESTNTTILIRALWQSVISAIIAAIIYIVIYAITNKRRLFLLRILLVANCTFVIVFLINLFSVIFVRK